MKAPAPITTRHGRTYHWQALDPSKAEYKATFGLRGPRGTTFLLAPIGIIAVGLWSGTTTSFDSVKRELESLVGCAPGMVGADRSISGATFKSWLA